jgi:hypothetical protein
MPTYEEIKPVADDLLVFIDDTGHETFAGNQGFYGLGGCLMTGFAYAYLKPKWRGVRKIINGDPEAPLHGSDITTNPKPESFAALRTFFEDRSFARIAVTTSAGMWKPLIRQAEPSCKAAPLSTLHLYQEDSHRRVEYRRSTKVDKAPKPFADCRSLMRGRSCADDARRRGGGIYPLAADIQKRGEKLMLEVEGQQP